MHPAKPKDNRIGNLQPCHKDINCFKGDLTFKQFNEELMIIQYRVVQGLRLKPEEKKIAELFDFEPDTYKTKLFFDIINLI